MTDYTKAKVIAKTMPKTAALQKGQVKSIKPVVKPNLSNDSGSKVTHKHADVQKYTKPIAASKPGKGGHTVHRSKKEPVYKLMG